MKKLTIMMAFMLCFAVLFSSCGGAEHQNGSESDTVLTSENPGGSQNAPNTDKPSDSQEAPSTDGGDSSQEVTDSEKASSEIVGDSQDSPDAEITPSVWNGTIAHSFAGGSGTEDDPYLISTGSQLAYLAREVNINDYNVYDKYHDKCFKLTNSIDLGGFEWDPIGCAYKGKSDFSKYRCFSGSFDGDGYTVSNFKITNPKYEYYSEFGLFGRIQDGSVSNLHIENFKIDVSLPNSTGIGYAGGLAGTCFGKISNCSATGEVNMYAPRQSTVGGLVGVISDSDGVNNCRASVDVSASSMYHAIAGGFAAVNRVNASNCYSTGNVKVIGESRHNSAGGFFGINVQATVSNCYSIGDVSIEHATDPEGKSMIGGFIASHSGATEKCYATGNVTVADAKPDCDIKAGCFVGLNEESGIITDCYMCGQEVKVNIDGMESGATNTLGTACTLEELNSAEFYTATLGWNAEVWDLSDLDFEDGKYPVLKSEK